MQDKENFEGGQMSYDDIIGNKEEPPKAVEEEREKNDMDRTGHGIILRSIDEVLHDSMIPYTETVVMDRALPRVEDAVFPPMLPNLIIVLPNIAIVNPITRINKSTFLYLA